MILIVDDTRRKMRYEVKEELFKRGIPCALSTTERMDIGLPCSVIIVTERYLLKDVQYFADIYNSPCVLLYEEKDLLDYVLKVYCERCLPMYTRGIIEYACGRFSIFNSVINFTKTEKRILGCLSCMSDYVSYELLSVFCLKDQKADRGQISVHICNINKKAKRAVGREIIECRRFSGYKLIR